MGSSASQEESQGPVDGMHFSWLQASGREVTLIPLSPEFFSDTVKKAQKMSTETRAGDFRSLGCFTLLYILTYIYSQNKYLTEVKQKMSILSLKNILDLGMNPTYLIFSV